MEKGIPHEKSPETQKNRHTNVYLFPVKALPDASLIGSDSALRVKVKTAGINTCCFHFKAPPGIGPGNKSFADFCLTAWLWRRLADE